MVPWPTVCKPTQLGGLGISDLKLQGFALQTRWLWLQKIDQDRAWSQLPIKTAPEVQAFFRASTFTTIGDGKQALFCEDRWINGETAMEIAPCLYHLVPSRIRQRQSVREGLTNRNWVRGIPRGLSVQPLIEYLHLRDAVSNVQLIEQPDRTIWRWTNDGVYTAKSAYNMLHIASTPFLGHKLIWKTWAPLRVKIFLWLAFKRRHWTNDGRMRHGLEAREECFLCDQGRETIDHLLANCPFTRELWFHILQALGKQLPSTAQTTIRW